MIPTPDTITSQWLSHCLQRTGHVGVEVTDFSQQRIGTGQIGSCYRLDLQLRGAGPDVPRSLVAKFASDDPASRQTGVALRNFLKEVRFYQELQPRLGIRTPRCYYAEIDGVGPDFALLLEDLAPAVQGDQLTGCDPVTARAAVLELVGLHAPCWGDAALKELDWLGPPPNLDAASTRNLYQQVLPGFLDRFGDRLDADQRAIIELFGSSAKGFGAGQGADDVFGLVHIDYRLDNLLIDARHRPPRITVVDWQSITIGRPLGDVAYFLGAGLEPGVRRPVEEDLVRAYHQALSVELSRLGKPAYSWAQCWQDYRLGSFAGFGVTVVAAMLVQRTERGDAMFTAMAQRHSRHALDLQADELLRP